MSEELAKGLTGATEALNTKLLTATFALAGLGYGVTADVDLGPPTGLRLALVKDDGTWRLVTFTENRENLTPLLNASRERRLRAVEMLPRLREELDMVAKAELAKVMASLRTLDAFLKTMHPAKEVTAHPEAPST